MKNVIELTDISKTFGNQQVLHNISMKIEKGSIYGFLGPNGSGKTTVMKIILNLLKADSGVVRVEDKVIDKKSYEYLKNIGSIIEYPMFYENLTAIENLDMHCSYMGYYDKNKIKAVMDIVNLKDVENKKVKEFSLGMKQRLGIARALITDPKILVLDEPINGLDPFGIKEVRELLVKVNKEFGTTILISSHIVSEIESISDTIGFIKEGALIKEMKMSEIEKEALCYNELTLNDVHKAAAILDGELNIKNFKIMNDKQIRIYEGGVDTKDINKHLILNDIEILETTRKTNSLEEYFIEIMSGGEKK